jgi:hypothetical protein
MSTFVITFYCIYCTGFVTLNVVFFQYVMMEHFFNCDYKVLCCSIFELPRTIKSLSKEQLEKLRQLPSFRCYVDTLPKKERAPLLVDDDHFKVSKLVVTVNLQLVLLHNWFLHSGFLK